MNHTFSQPVHVEMLQDKKSYWHWLLLRYKEAAAAASVMADNKLTMMTQLHAVVVSQC